MNDKSTEFLEQLLMVHDYHQLSAKDKLLVDETIGGENAYARLKSLLHSTAEEKEMELNVAIKTDLISKMKSKNPPIWFKVAQFNIPAYAAVLLIFFFIGLIYFLGPKQKIIVEKEVLVVSELDIDTLIIKTKPDTIFLDKIQVVKVPVYITPKKEEKVIVAKKNKPKLEGKSLADQEELRDLLISSD